MNKIQQPEGDAQPEDAITRRLFLGGLVTAAVTGVLVTGHEKENNTKVYNLNDGYSNMKMNFDEFFVYANQNNSASWSRDNENWKHLHINTGKQGESYIVSLYLNQIKISLSSYNDEFLCRYSLDTSILEVRGGTDLQGVMNHFGLVQSLIQKQYPNF